MPQIGLDTNMLLTYYIANSKQRATWLVEWVWEIPSGRGVNRDEQERLCDSLACSCCCVGIS